MDCGFDATPVDTAGRDPLMLDRVAPAAAICPCTLVHENALLRRKPEVLGVHATKTDEMIEVLGHIITIGRESMRGLP
jgi:hypothetical protein